MKADSASNGETSSAGTQGIAGAPVLDQAQLRRITSLHRGFAYQHLYAVGCLLRMGGVNAHSLRTERDEDVEVVFEDRYLYLQVKTRQGKLTWGDVRAAVEQFTRIRDEHTAGRRHGTPWLIVVTNTDLGPDLLARTLLASWPTDVALICPGRPHPVETWLPEPRRDLASALQWCTGQAELIPFGSLTAPTLVWKLAAHVQYACTGAHGHEFLTADLPQLYEQFVEELQAFPELPGVYRPHDGEPDLASENPVRLVVGFPGAGKTTWAAHAAQHSPQPVTYFDTAGMSSASVPGALARELAARYFSGASAEPLPVEEGIDVLRAVHARLVRSGITIVVVLDNVHLMASDDIRLVVGALSTAKLVLLGHPQPEQIPLASRLGIERETLHGWDTDTIAAVFDSEGCTLDFATAANIASITAGLPLYVLNSAQITRSAYAGDGAAFCTDVRAETHATPTAQELILDKSFGVLPENARTVAALLAIAGIPVTVEEFQELTAAAGLPRSAQAVRDLTARGLTQSFADGRLSLHDAVRPLASVSADELPDDLTHRVRLALLQVLEGHKGLSRVGRWMMLLVETGQIDRLLDLTSEEGFYESGYPREIHTAIEDAATDLDRSAVSRLEAHSALAIFAYLDGDWAKFARHVHAMEHLAAADDGGIGSRERALLASRQFVLYGRTKDVRRLEEAFAAAVAQVAAGSAEDRGLRYSYAQGLYFAEDFARADKLACELALVYCKHLGLGSADFNGPPTRLRERLRAYAGPSDDYKRLADCFGLSVRSRRSLGVVSGPMTIAAIPAMKLYSIIGAWRQTVDSGQEFVDILMNTGQHQQALKLIEQLLPLTEEYNLPEMTIGLRSHCAVVLAHNGDIAAARAEIDSLAAYEPTPDQAGDILRQRAIIEALAAQRQTPGP